jgi:hypothetical protein
MEHVAGVGGEAARIIGSAIKGGLDQWHPSFERELLARADAAIVQAGDTREVRVNLTSLFSRTVSSGTGSPGPRKAAPGR